MTFIEIKGGGPDVPDGVYTMILTEIEGDPNNQDQPRLVVPETGPNAGKELYFWDWRFAIDQPGTTVDGTPFKYGTSTSTGPRSKMFPLLTALLNGARPELGAKFSKRDLIGRQVLATVQRTPEGYCDIVGFSAVPLQMQQQRFAQQTGAPTQGTPAAAPNPQPQPAAVPVGAASTGSDLPF